MSKILVSFLVFVSLWIISCSALGDSGIEQTGYYVPTSVINPGQLLSGCGDLGLRSRDIVDELVDPVDSGGMNGWGSYAPFHYQRTRFDPFSYRTGLVPWSKTRPVPWSGTRPVPWSGTFFGGPGVTPGGLNIFGKYGIGVWNLDTPIRLGFLGKGEGVAVGTISEDPIHRAQGFPYVGYGAQGFPYVGYGAQGEGGIGYGMPLSTHPIYKLFPGLYHPPPQNVFF